METTLFYLLRVSIAAGILYSSYKLILSKKTFHAINRAVLLNIVALSLILPLFTIQLPRFSNPASKPPIFAPSTVNIPIENNPIYTNSSMAIPFSSSTPIPWSQYLLIAYLTGAAFVLLRLLISYVRIRLIIGKADKQELNDKTTLCISKQKISPFSWKRFIVITASDMNDDSYDIIRHEQAHLVYKHSYDLLLFNLYTLFLWFNPFAWLLRRELQITHEYQADEKVLSQGVDLKNYQLLLIRKCVGEQKFALAHNFEYNDLQKRIRMTMKEKSGAMQKWLYGTLIIAIIGSIAGISCTKSKTENNGYVKGHVEGGFSSGSMNGKIQIHTRKETPDIIKDSKGRIISQTEPGDSILAEFDVTNGKFSFDYNFSEQHEVSLVFIDGKNAEWKLDFINPYEQSISKFTSNYCVFDHKANMKINVRSDRKWFYKSPDIIRVMKKNPGINYKIYRSMEAQISGSPATAEMFRKQLRGLDRVKERTKTNAEFETGTVFDSQTKVRLSNVKIINLNTKEETLSDKNGCYKIKAYPKNILSFSLDGYVRSNYYAEYISNSNMLLRKMMSRDTNVENQTYSVKGEVLDDNFEPIASAHVWVNGTNISCLSDKYGKYTLTVKSTNIVCVAKKDYKDTATVFIAKNTDATSFLHK